MRVRPWKFITCVVPVLIVTGCSTANHTNQAELPKHVPGASVQVVTRDPQYVYPGSDGKPELCINGITDSNPVKCSKPGIALIAWPKSAKLAADYLVTGHFDGSTLRVTKVHRWNDASDKAEPDWGDGQNDYGTRCPAPQGGWQVSNPGTTTSTQIDNLEFAAEKLPGYTAFWWDYSRTPPGGKENDPNYATANVLVDRDVAGARRMIRRLWGGALCVTKSHHSSAEQQRINEEFDKVPGVLLVSDKWDSIDVLVTRDDGSIQRWADRRFGRGYVRITSALQPAS